MSNCPIGLECLGEQCTNLSSCEEWCTSWPLPYQRFSTGLYVQRLGVRWKWDGCWEIVETSSELRFRIRDAWEEAGFFVAVSIPQNLCEIERACAYLNRLELSNYW